ncbi:MAG: hypothetical protein HWE24_06570 [Oceanospirillaceae bacterium]|nr:hypothetical protein [Oceanospirillaceae bacterium]
MNKWLSLFLIAVFTGCGIVKVEELDDEVRAVIVEELRYSFAHSEKRDSVRFDGVYAIPSTDPYQTPPKKDSYALGQPIQFLPNGLIIRSTSSFKYAFEYEDYVIEKEAYLSKQSYTDDIFCGFYFIKNGKIHAWVPLYYNRTRVSWSEVVLTHFEGKIENNGLISNWHLSEPYILPKDWPKEGEENIEPDPSRPAGPRGAYDNYQRWKRLQTPVDLIFHSVDMPERDPSYNYQRLAEYLGLEINL